MKCFEVCPEPSNAGDGEHQLVPSRRKLRDVFPDSTLQIEGEIVG